MAYTTVPTVVTGQTYLASDYNTYVKDNITALFPYTAAGDIAYANSASALARLGKPANVGLLTNSSAGIPSYLNFSSVGLVPYSSSAAAMGALAKPTNVGLLTNNSAGAIGYTDFPTAGSIAYSASTSTMGVLAKPTNVGLLTNSSLGTPSYLNFPAVGAIPYASSLTAMSALANPANVGLLSNTAAGALSYLNFLAAGSIPYSTSATAMGVLAKPANVGLLLNTAAGALSWLNASSTDAYKNVRVNSTGNGFEFAAAGVTVETFGNATSYTYATNTQRDMPNSSLSVVVTVPSTIVVFGQVVEYGGDTYGFFEAWLSIDATVMTYSARRTYNISQIDTVPIFGIKTGVTAGTKTIKIREQCAAGNYTVESKNYIVLVIPE